MMKGLKINKCLLVSSLAIAASLVVGGTYASYIVTDNASPISIKVGLTTIGGSSVKFYTSYNGTSWGGLHEEEVLEGETVDTVPTVSLTGYTFKGWIEGSAPDSTHYTATISSSTISTTTITSDKTYYPILESDDSFAYAGSSYYDLNSDVTLSVSSIASVKVGKKYLGVSGIPNASASINTSQNLYSGSGVYQFHDDGNIFRKVGFKPNSSWRSLWSGQYASFSFHTWGDYGDYDYLRPQDAGNYVYYAYIPATNHNFKIVRNAPDATSIDWNQNHSANLKLSDSYGSGTTYSSSSIILGQYDDVGWNNDWGSNKAWWGS